MNAHGLVPLHPCYAVWQQLMHDRAVPRLAVVPVARALGVAVRVLQRAAAAAVRARDVHPEPRPDHDQILLGHAERLVLADALLDVL